MSMVLCKLPKAGLGNQLFPLMKAYLFGHLNNLPVVVTGYHQLQIGPYLRREKSKRSYRHYFKFQKSVIGEQLDKWRTSKGRFKQVIDEPPIERVTSQQSCLYQFSEISHWSDYFSGLKEYRDIVRELLFDILSDSIKEELDKLNAPVVGVHIRMGDFRKLAQNEDFSKVGAVRTPEDYFIQVIQKLRQANGNNLPVAVFTDGYRHEFESLFTLPSVSMVENNKDIVDLLLLSKSKVIVASAGSTFSYWSGFLSDSPLILHPDHIHNTIRSQKESHLYFEGAIDTQNKLLIKSIDKINYETAD